MNIPTVSDRIISISAKAEHLNTIAWLSACVDLVPERREKAYTDVLLGISDICTQIIDELDEVTADLERIERSEST